MQHFIKNSALVIVAVYALFAAIAGILYVMNSITQAVVTDWLVKGCMRRPDLHGVHCDHWVYHPARQIGLQNHLYDLLQYLRWHCHHAQGVYAKNDRDFGRYRKIRRGTQVAEGAALLKL